MGAADPLTLSERVDVAIESSLRVPWSPELLTPACVDELCLEVWGPNRVRKLHQISRTLEGLRDSMLTDLSDPLVSSHFEMKNLDGGESSSTFQRRR